MSSACADNCGPRRFEDRRPACSVVAAQIRPAERVGHDSEDPVLLDDATEAAKACADEPEAVIARTYGDNRITTARKKAREAAQTRAAEARAKAEAAAADPEPQPQPEGAAR